jgi:hypothetical protein
MQDENPSGISKKGIVFYTKYILEMKNISNLFWYETSIRTNSNLKYIINEKHLNKSYYIYVFLLIMKKFKNDQNRNWLQVTIFIFLI